MTLTFVRTAELINMEWNEIDFDNHLWRIPAYKMKMAYLILFLYLDKLLNSLKDYNLLQVTSNLFFIITVQQSL
jgi:integrase